jgi:hypothetical protein
VSPLNGYKWRKRGSIPRDGVSSASQHFSFRAVRRARHGHGRRFDGWATGSSVPSPSRRGRLKILYGTGRVTGRPSRVTGRNRLRNNCSTNFSGLETFSNSLEVEYR